MNATTIATATIVSADAETVTELVPATDQRAHRDAVVRDGRFITTSVFCARGFYVTSTVDRVAA